MRHSLFITVLVSSAVALLTAPAWADVVVRGPFGGVIVVVPSPVDVLVGPGVFVGVPPRQTYTYPAPVAGKSTNQPEIVSRPMPVIRPAPVPETELLPQPKLLPGSSVPPSVLPK
jgi:hypothetical protein